MKDLHRRKSPEVENSRISFEEIENCFLRKLAIANKTMNERYHYKTLGYSQGISGK